MVRVLAAAPYNGAVVPRELDAGGSALEWRLTDPTHVIGGATPGPAGDGMVLFYF